jgi:serine phosphatase RsbU (regulator of sigma subunit)/anti-sigma regulatory factor (Ser/Thr protein kinase)
MFRNKKIKLAVLCTTVLTIILILITTAFSFISYRAVRKIGYFAVSKDDKNVHNISSNLFLEITRRTAKEYSNYLKHAKDITELLAEQIHWIGLKENSFNETYLKENIKLLKYKNRDFYVSPQNSQFSAFYWGDVIDGKVPDIILKEINILNILSPILNSFIRYSGSFYSCIWIHGKRDFMFAAPGSDVYYKNMRNRKAFEKYFNAFNIISSHKKQSTTGKSFWIKPYKDITGITALSVFTPTYNKDGEIMAVVGLDINLNIVLKRMLKSRLLVNEEYDEEKNINVKIRNNLFDGFLFLMDEKSNIIAFPSDYTKLFSLPYMQTEINPSEASATSLLNTSNPLLRITIKNILKSKSGIETIKLKGNSYFIAFSKLDSANWTLGFVIKEKSLMSAAVQTRHKMQKVGLESIKHGILISLFFLVISITITFLFFQKYIFKIIKRMIVKIRKMAGGDFQIKFEDNSISEIAEVASTFNYLGSELNNYVSNLSKEIKIREEIEAEVKIGSIVQSYLLSDWIEISNGIALTSAYMPYAGVSGDLYDFIPLEDGKYLTYIGDISGHGIQASLIMSAIQTAVRIEITNESQNINIINILNKLNLIFSKQFPDSSYMTFLIGIIDQKKDTFEYFSAGHPPLIKYNIKTGLAEMNIEKGSFPIGMFTETLYKASDIDKLIFDKNTAILLYTDGLFECTSKMNRKFDIENLIHTISNNKFISFFSLPDELLEHLSKDGFSFDDDVTAMLLFKEDKNSNTMSFVIEPKLDKTFSIIKNIIKVLAKKQINEDVVNATEILLTEHLNNIVVHGYKNNTSSKLGKIYLSLIIEENKLSIFTLDKGVEWHNNDKDSIILNNGQYINGDIDEYMISGRGLNIINSIAEEISYQRVNTLNQSSFTINIASFANKNSINPHKTKY